MDRRPGFLVLALVAAAPDGVLAVKFVAKEKPRTASIFDVRLIKMDSNPVIAR